MPGAEAAVCPLLQRASMASDIFLKKVPNILVVNIAQPHLSWTHAPLIVSGSPYQTTARVEIYRYV
jgi:hypothetical protein